MRPIPGTVTDPAALRRALDSAAGYRDAPQAEAREPKLCPAWIKALQRVGFPLEAEYACPGRADWIGARS